MAALDSASTPIYVGNASLMVFMDFPLNWPSEKPAIYRNSNELSRVFTCRITYTLNFFHLLLEALPVEFFALLWI